MRKCFWLLLVVFLFLLSARGMPAWADDSEDQPATLHVITQVSNTNGGTATASDFMVHVASSVTGEVYSNPGAESGTTYTLDAGTYTVSEDVYAGYTSSFSGDCDSRGNITLNPGDDKTVTITNQDQPASSGTAITKDAVLNASEAPTVTSVSPKSGYPGGGTYVTIKGTGFTGATEVDFGPNNPANNVLVKVVDDGTITCNTPPGGGTVDVTVTTPSGTSALNPPYDQFTYWPPVVQSVSPNFGPETGGTQVRIVGKNFVPNHTSVSFGNNPASNVNVKSDTEIWATSPAGQGTVDVLVTTNGITGTPNDNDKFTYMPTLAVLSTSPHDGATEVPTGHTEIRIRFDRPIKILPDEGWYDRFFSVDGKYKNFGMPCTPSIDPDDPDTLIVTTVLPEDDTVTVSLHDGCIADANNNAIVFPSDGSFSFLFKTHADTAVTMDDPVLEQVIRDTLLIPDDRAIHPQNEDNSVMRYPDPDVGPDWVPIKAMDDLTSLIHEGWWDWDKIKSISGLEDAVNLEKLTLYGDNITNLKPLQGLLHLKEIDLSSSTLDDTGDNQALAPLANLPLEHLELVGCQINNVTALHGITTLNYLALYNNAIQDITPLENLTGLTYLDLSGNNIENITPLTKMTGLTYLNLSGNEKISGFNLIGNLTNLNDLELASTGLSDISFLSVLNTLQTLDLSDNYIVDLTPLQGLGNLHDLDLSNNCLNDADLRVLEQLVWGQGATVNVGGNQDLDLAAYEQYGEIMQNNGVYLPDFDDYQVITILPSGSTPSNEDVAVGRTAPVVLNYDEQQFDIKRLGLGSYLSKVKIYVNGVYDDDLTKSLSFDSVKTTNSTDPDTGDPITVVGLDHDPFPDASTITIVVPARLNWQQHSQQS